jgi:hypothetical protein
MVAALTRKARARRAAAFAAALALLFQALSVGAGSFLSAGPLADASASVREDHSEHHNPGDPNERSKEHPCGWCILCGKLGVALGTPPHPLGALLPYGSSATQFAPAAGASVLGQTYGVLPLGARAPPRFV